MFYGAQYHSDVRCGCYLNTSDVHTCVFVPTKNIEASSFTRRYFAEPLEVEEAKPLEQFLPPIKSRADIAAMVRPKVRELKLSRGALPLARSNC